jgi:hypothetical protein
MTDEVRWQDDYGYKPNFIIPPEIENGSNPNCSKENFIKWAEGRHVYRYALVLRYGTTELDARFALSDKLLRTLEHGKTYTWRELGVDKDGKVQFIVEKL